MEEACPLKLSERDGSFLKPPASRTDAARLRYSSSSSSHTCSGIAGAADTLLLRLRGRRGPEAGG